MDNAEKATEDFFLAMDLASNLISDLDDRGLEKGAALGGALTQFISHLLASSQDSTVVMAILASCMSNASFHAQSMDIQSHPGTDSLQ